jgi:TRAP-type C4-dicarboxylate transport system substrate-binding protein
MTLLRRLAALAAAFTLLALPASALAQANVVKLATLVPEGSVWDKALREMGSQWSQATGGRVTLRVYPGGVSGDETDVVRKIRIGQLQAAAVTTVGLASIDPAFNLFNSPMFFESYPELYATLRAMEPDLRKRLEAKGFVLLAWGHGGWVYFFSKTPVSDIAGLRKVKMYTWAGDDAMVQRWKSNGFQPVALAMTDIVTGLQTGMIDATPGTPLITLFTQGYKQTPNMMGLGLAPLVGGLVIGKAAWNRIPEADRARLMESTSTLQKRLEVEVPRQDTLAVAEMRKRGLAVNAVTPAATAEFRQLAERFSSDMRATAVPPEVVDAARRARDAFRAQNGKAGR